MSFHFTLSFLLIVCNTRQSSLSSPAANLASDSLRRCTLLRRHLALIITTHYVFIAVDASNDSKVPIELIGNLRCVEKASEEADE